ALLAASVSSDTYSLSLHDALPILGLLGDRASQSGAGRTAVQRDAHGLPQQAEGRLPDGGFLREVVDLAVAEGRLLQTVGPPRHGASVDSLKGAGPLERGEIASDGLRGDVEVDGQIRDIHPSRVADQFGDASLPFFSEHVRPFLLSAGGELRLTVPSDNRRGYLLV